MNRRGFLHTVGAATVVALAPGVARAAGANYGRLLVLVELKGGNDGLNTVVPYADPMYARLRPKLGIRREEVIQLSEREGFHPALAAFMPMWQASDLAVVQGVGYPKPNL